MVEIKEVTTKTDLKKFIHFPNKLYEGNPYYVPALDMDELGMLDPAKNPAYEFCNVKCFLAYRDGKLCGRVAAILNKAYNDVTGKKYMRFSRLDFTDDPEVVEALMGAVEQYAREKGMDLVHGPLGFTDLDREGMLVEGFDKPGLYVTYYNHPYYPERLAGLGYAKDVDYVEYEIRPPKQEEAERLIKISDYIMKKLGLSLVPLKKMDDIKPFINGIFDLLNRAYSHLYGYVEITDKLRDATVEQFFSLMKPEFLKVVLDASGEVVAAALNAPNISRACRKAKGRLFPFGIFHLLHDKNHPDVIDLYLIAVKPELQGKGVNAILLTESLKSIMEAGIGKANALPELETNNRVRDQWKNFDTAFTKRRRIFIKELQPGKQGS